MTSRGTKYWNSGAIPLIAPEILGNIIGEISDLAIVISEAGLVLSVMVNPHHDLFAGLDRWEGQAFRDTLTVESVPKFDSRLAQFLDSEGPVRQVELNHKEPDRSREYPIRYSFHRISPDGAVLLLGRDLRPIAEMQQQLVSAQIALEHDHESQREFETRFRVLMETTTDAIVLVSMHNGRIAEANRVAGRIFSTPVTELVGSSFADGFKDPDGRNLIETLSSQALSDSDRPIVTRMRDGDETVSLYPTLFRAAGERIMLCRVIARDCSDSNHDELTDSMRGLFAKAADGIVFARQNGQILSANDSFLNMVSCADDLALRGRSLADYMQRGSVDFRVMTENASRAGRMRLYATRLAGDYGAPLSVEASVSTLTAGDDTVFAFVFRESHRAEGSRTVSTPDEQMQSVVELVGSAPLKDIVAETTNVVEKMCIETAVELTKNNRVAAAEMLGLSRQSLYVKLRKYGIMERDRGE